MTMTFVRRSFKVMSTIATSIALKLLELETKLYGFVLEMPSGRLLIKAAAKRREGNFK